MGTSQCLRNGKRKKTKTTRGRMTTRTNTIEPMFNRFNTVIWTLMTKKWMLNNWNECQKSVRGGTGFVDNLQGFTSWHKCKMEGLHMSSFKGNYYFCCMAEDSYDD